MTVIWLWMAAGAYAADVPAAVDYRKDIVPILARHCVGCHNADEANGGLGMHSFAALSKGGDNGPTFVASKSAESKLYRLITGQDEPRMPPEENPAPNADQIDLIRRWIDDGAVPPSDVNEVIALDPATPEIKPRSAPPRRIHSAAWSPDGKWLAIGRQNEVILVDPQTGFIERTFVGVVGNVTCVSFSPDGSRLLAAGGRPGIDGVAILWQVSDGAVVREFRGHKDSLYAARLSPDQSLLATAGYDKVIRIWNANDAQLLFELKGHNDAVYALVFRPDGKVLTSASGDRTVKLWDVTNGERLDTLSESLKDLNTVVFLPDGTRVLAAGADNRIRAWRVTPSAKEGTNEILESRYGHDAAILALAASPDGSLIASSAANRTVKLWSGELHRELRSLESQSDWVVALVFSSDGKQIFTGRMDGTAAIYATDTGTKLKDLIPAEKPPPPPLLARKQPIGVRRGSTVRVELTGEHLAKANQVILSNASLNATISTDPPRSDHKLFLDVSAADDAPIGRHELAVETPGGKTAALAVVVDFIDQWDSPPSDAVSLPAGVRGTLKTPGETDVIRFEAKTGQQLVFDLTREGGSKANLVLRITGEDGRTLASARQIQGAIDAPLVWSAPADGIYSAKVHDLAFAGSPEHYYHLAVGEFPVVTGVYPLVVAVGMETKVEWTGVNLPADAGILVKPDKAGELPLNVDKTVYRIHKSPTVVAVAAVVRETEPNNDPASATNLSLPSEATGRFFQDKTSTDVDHYRFSARAGEEWIFETESARRGLDVDTRLDVLTTDGAPIDRVWLAAVRDSYVEFRGLDAAQLEIRCKNWEEMELNELMYMNGEVTKLFRHPRGPDSGFLFYPLEGRRRTYFDTTSTTHALEDPVYIVEPHPPGTELVSNGLPVFKVTYSNDDASGGQLGADSRLFFRAPSDGEYLLRLVETRGAAAPERAYRLIARRPSPDFQVAVSTRTPAVHRGSGREVSFKVQRLDGFEGAIDIVPPILPGGLALSNPIRIEAGHESVSAVLTAAADISPPSAESFPSLIWKATASVNDATVEHDFGGFESVKIVDKPGIVVRMEPARITIAPGTTVAAKLTIERHGHAGRVQFEMAGLPHGVIVDNIGLNGILIREGETEREVFLTARPWVARMDRPFFARANEVDNQASPAVLLSVRPPEQVAKDAP